MTTLALGQVGCACRSCLRGRPALSLLAMYVLSWAGRLQWSLLQEGQGPGWGPGHPQAELLILMDCAGP